MSLDLLKLLIQSGNSALDQPSVHFQLFLSGSSCPDSSSQSGKRSAKPCKAGLPVFQLCKLHLDLPFACRSTSRKDVQDQKGTVHDLCVQLCLQIADLRRGQLIIAYDPVSFCLPQKVLKLHDLAFSQIGSGMDLFPLLDQASHAHRSGRLGKILQLI